MKHVEDPLDDFFNTSPSKEIVEYQEISEGELSALQAPEAPTKDAEDIEIDQKIDTVYTAALDAFNEQTAYIQVIEPRYAARNAEVAANYLAIALNAVATRARVKGDRKRGEAFVPFANRTQGNVVVANREDLIRMISIDAEIKDENK